MIMEGVCEISFLSVCLYPACVCWRAWVFACVCSCMCWYCVKILACESLYAVKSPTTTSMQLADSLNPKDSQSLPLHANGET